MSTAVVPVYTAWKKSHLNSHQDKSINHNSLHSTRKVPLIVVNINSLSINVLDLLPHSFTSGSLTVATI